MTNLYINVAAFLFYLLIKLIGLTLRFNRGLREDLAQAKAGKNVVFAIWHQSSFVLFYVFGFTRAVLLVTAETRGKIIAKCAGWLGFQAIFIPTIKESFDYAASLNLLLRSIKEGNDIVIAVDGPCGPLYNVRPGIFYLSEKAGIPILPVGVKAPFKLTLFWRWDKYFVPLPLSPVQVRLGKAMWLKKGGEVELGKELKTLSS